MRVAVSGLVRTALRGQGKPTMTNKALVDVLTVRAERELSLTVHPHARCMHTYL